jgi:hypothetical protein
MTPFRKIQQTSTCNNNFLDFLIKTLNLKNDAALSRALGVAPPVVSKIRNNLRLRVGASLLIMSHELTGVPIEELKKYLIDPTAEV